MMNSTILDSKFIIDGLPMELTPRQILGGNQCTYPSESIVDESLDPSVGKLGLCVWVFLIAMLMYCGNSAFIYANF